MEQPAQLTLPLEPKAASKETPLITLELFLNEKGVGIRQSSINHGDLERTLTELGGDWEFGQDVMDIFKTARTEFDAAIQYMDQYFGRVK
jgi:hypothetical protein